MVKEYIQAIKIVQGKYSKEDSLYPFMVCAIYGLLRKYQGYYKKDISKNRFYTRTEIHKRNIKKSSNNSRSRYKR